MSPWPTRGCCAMVKKSITNDVIDYRDHVIDFSVVLSALISSAEDSVVFLLCTDSKVPAFR